MLLAPHTARRPARTGYLVINAQWQGMLAEVIERGVAAGVFRCKSPQRAARQLFALAMGYADDLMLKPSAESAEAVLGEVLEVARLLLDFS